MKIVVHGSKQIQSFDRIPRATSQMPTLLMLSSLYSVFLNKILECVCGSYDEVWL